MGTLLQFCQATVYTNDWAIRIRADQESVNRIAEKYGFTNMGQVGVIQNRLYTHTRPSICRLDLVVQVVSCLSLSVYVFASVECVGL